jgi:hypothetical protein
MEIMTRQIIVLLYYAVTYLINIALLDYRLHSHRGTMLLMSIRNEYKLNRYFQSY